MPTTATSAASYAALKRSGVTAPSRVAIFGAAIKCRGPFTRQDLAKVTGIERGYLAARVDELIKKGALVKTGKLRKNPATGLLVETLQVDPAHRANWRDAKRRRLV